MGRRGVKKAQKEPEQGVRAGIEFQFIPRNLPCFYWDRFTINNKY